MVKSLPMMVSSRISTPSFFMFSISASMITSGRRNSGMPYFSTPPATCSASKIVTLTPLRARSPAHARPDGPDPMMAALFCAVESICGGSSHPRPMAASATKRSSRPMATGLNFAPTTQVASHWDSCGHTRPHTAGSALDVFRIWYERLMSRFCRAAMKPGISMPTGQPGTQRGFLQRRQRSASCSAPSRSSPSVTSLKLWIRSSAGWCGMIARSGGIVLIFFGTRGPGVWARGSGSSQMECGRPFDSALLLRLASLADSERKRSMAAFSSRSKRFWRSASSSKLTRWPSKSAPSTQANFILPPMVTRQEPHMPVPSTMIEFRLTMVGTPKGRVTSEQAFIMGMGPMATTSRISFSRARTSASACVTKPWRP